MNEGIYSNHIWNTAGGFGGAGVSPARRPRHKTRTLQQHVEPPMTLDECHDRAVIYRRLGLVYIPIEVKDSHETDSKHYFVRALFDLCSAFLRRRRDVAVQQSALQDP